MSVATLVLRSVWGAWKRNEEVSGRHYHHPISLSLRQGEWMAVVGPNGAGKSTLLRAIAGVADLCGGRVEIDGRFLRPYCGFDRFRVGAVYVGQKPALPGSNHLWEDAQCLAFSNRPGLYNERAVANLERRLTDAGWLDATGIAASLFDLVVAVLSAPTLLLLDEIDARAARQPRRDVGYPFLRSLLPKTTVVFVEHDLATAYSQSDYVLRLKRESPPVFVPSSQAAAQLKFTPPGGISTSKPANVPFNEDAARLLELDSSPSRLLSRALMAGRVVHVREWRNHLIQRWPFLRAASSAELSGGEQIILIGLASAASLHGQFDDRLIAHIAEANRDDFAKYMATLRAERARARDASSPADQLENGSV